MPLLYRCRHKKHSVKCIRPGSIRSINFRPTDHDSFCSLNDQGQINIFTFAQINKEQDNNDNF